MRSSAILSLAVAVAAVAPVTGMSIPVATKVARHDLTAPAQASQPATELDPVKSTLTRASASTPVVDLSDDFSSVGLSSVDSELDKRNTTRTAAIEKIAMEVLPQIIALAAADQNSQKRSIGDGA
ncbi:hypothetical protein V8E55_004368 [Tylopilus felleus]